MSGGGAAALLGALLVLLGPGEALSRELWTSEDMERSASLTTALKWSGLVSRAPYDPLLSPEEEGAASLFRLRLSLGAALGERASLEVAYEQRSLQTAGAGAAGAGILPSEAPAPYRICQLDDSIHEIDGEFSYRHELDRALGAFHLERAEITVGRQAIGFGRGVLFGAVDIFAPFSPTEVDREWRRGVDALRADLRLTETLSFETVVAFGSTWDDSALIGRLRGYAGDLDGEIIFGKRAQDSMLAGTISAVVGDAEAHLEVALFEVEEDWPDDVLFRYDNFVGKAVLGGSYTFDVGSGLTVFAEYHYSGFGLGNIETAVAHFADPGWSERLLRGDMQILGQHAVGLQAVYGLSDAWSTSLVVLASPKDGSGLAAPGLTWDFSDNVTIVASALLPWGKEPEGGVLRSEYGGAPASIFLQIRIYD